MNVDHLHKERRSQMKEIGRTEKPNSTSRGTYLSGLYRARLMTGLSQRDLAQMVGVSQSTVQQLEAQKRGAYPKTLKKLCRAFNVNPIDLMAPRIPSKLKERKR